MRCPHCGQDHPDNALFCPKYGKPLARSRKNIIPRAVVACFVLCFIVASALLIYWLRVADSEHKLNNFLLQGATSTPTIVTFVGFAEEEIIVIEEVPKTSTSTAEVSPSSSITAVVLKSTVSPTSTRGPWEACKEAPLSRLLVGDRAYVSYEPPLSNRVRDTPGTHGKVLGSIKPGEKVIVLDGPACANNWVWWRVRSEETDLTGWTVEGDIDNYWLIPVP